MKNFFNNIWVHIVFVFAIAFLVVFKSNGYCMAIPSAIWGSFSIASEYVINHAGGSIDNSNFVASDINNPFTHSSSFGSAYANSLGANLSSNVSSEDGFDWLDGYGKIDDVDLSKYPTADAAQFLLKLVPDGVNYTPERYQIKKFKAGVISIFYLIDKQTQTMVADTFNNIAIQIDALSQQEIDSIIDSCSVRYPNTAYHSPNIRITSTDNSNVSYAQGTTFYYNVDFGVRDDIFYFTNSVPDSNGMYYVYFVCPANHIPTTAHVIRDSDNSSYPHRDFGELYGNFTRESQFTINNVVFNQYRLEFSFPSGSHVGLYVSPFYSNFAFSSLEAVKAYISEHSDEFLPTYGTLVDSQNVGYKVPTLRGQIVGLQDVYPALQAIREGSIAVPIDDGLSIGLTESIEDTIADTIAEAIAKGITQVKEDDEDPNPEPEKPDFPEFPEEIPPSYFPSFIPDLFPTDMFSIFKPVFDIVGVDYSMFDTWMLIPAVFIALFIFYVIISVL